MLRYVLACALALASPLAFAAKPTDAQIDQLLEITRARSMVEGMLGQVGDLQKQMVQQMLDGREVTPAEAARIERLTAVSSRNIREMLTWERLLPIYHRVYAEALDAEDIDAMIAFYKTPAGQHLIERMPVVVQKTMGEVQAMLGPAIKKMQDDLATEMAAIKAESEATP